MKTVERGAALLDERVPGWEQHIDLGELDLRSTCDCILGQLNGRGLLGSRPSHPCSRYDRGRRFLNLKDTGQYGFTIWGFGHFEHLTAAWKKLILHRRRVSARSRV